MTRSLKSLGLLVGALLVLCGLMAQAASAHTPATFTSALNTTTITGKKKTGTVTTFTVTGQTVTCETEEFHGHQVGVDVKEVTITPTYTECTAFGFVGAKVTGFGHYPAVEGAGPYCDYVLKATGKSDLSCPAGKDVTVEVGTTCISHIPAQTELGTVTYTTENIVTEDAVKHHDLTVNINLGGITVTHTDLNFLCPFAGSGEVANATLVGASTVWGEDPSNGAIVGITWHATVV